MEFMLNERPYSHQTLLMLCMMLLCLTGGMIESAGACRVLEPPPQAIDTLWVHLEGFCFTSDQREWAVKGNDVLEAVKNGKNLDFQGALVVDDVMFDQLPLQAVVDIPDLPAAIQERLQQEGVAMVRVIPGSITIRDSQFEKNLATNLVNDVLVVLGEVNISGSTFLQSLDFSKIMFAKPVVFTDVNVENEGFFIGAQFEDTVNFSHTNFGTHSRFHKAIFRAPVTFADVQFQGVAEFLEVEFQQAADFSRANFMSGTGFSGSIFRGHANFSGIKTEREVYFRFSEFKQQVSFRDAQIRNVLDFSNSSFEGEHDFSNAEFAVAPDFTASNISVDVSVSGRRPTQQSQWLLFGGLIILVGIYLWISKRKIRGHSA